MAAKFCWRPMPGNNKILGFKITDNGTLTAFPGSPAATGSQPGAIIFGFNDFVYVVNRGR